MTKITFPILLVVLVALNGCTSLAKGFAEVLLDKEDEVDQRRCQIWGNTLGGIAATLGKSKGKTKVLMIHGVGDQIPGYSTLLMEGLAKQLKLNMLSKHFKEISLTNFPDQNKKLGNLRVNRLLNKEKTQELLFYELTWSTITATDKQVLAYDNSGEYSFRRTAINDLLKKFSNSTGPDPMIYLGKKRIDILTAFNQSLCWMMMGDWNDLPQQTDQPCDPFQKALITNIPIDDYVLISHSLGSRITIDGLQLIATRAQNFQNDSKETIALKKRLIAEFREKRIPIFMLSNQLPLLQMGRDPPEVTGQTFAYCKPTGDFYSKRIFKEIDIIAFSDPNDILSYAVPPGYAEKNLDSRLCVETTNININIANTIDLFGMGKLANPLEAHLGYDHDERVIALISQGIGNANTAKIIKERCEWIETID